MSLLDIKNYLMQKRFTSLEHLCHYFKCDADVLRGMLSHWVQKGKVRCCKKTPACSTKCFQCKPQTIEIYEWVGAV